MADSTETVLITGASEGIGRDLADCFAEEGCGLVLLARREGALRDAAERIRERRGVRVVEIVLDLSVPDAPGRVAERLERDGIRIDVLVNNAGFGARGALSSLGLERQMRIIAVNVSALTDLTRRFLPGMIERGRGGILNVASTAAFVPGPYMAVYYATKAYVLSFTEAVAEEVRGTGLSVTCLAPGPTSTGFARVAGLENSTVFRARAMDSRQVARFGHEAFRKGRILAVPGMRNRATPLAARLLPRALLRRVSAALQRR